MRRVLTALSLVALLPLTACGGGDDDTTLTVLAAASLTGTFTELAATFEEAHPGVEVELVFGSSTTLAEQAVDGAPGDVLATADEASMTVAEDGGVLAGRPEAFASNRLVLVAPADNPAGIESLTDLDDPDVDYVRCAETAPCGSSAVALLDDAGIQSAPASEEVDVKAVLARVTQGEADAGLVYRTDSRAAGDAVREVATDDLDDYGPAYANNYYVAAVDGSVDGSDDATADLAADFVALVTGAEAAEVLGVAGFGGIVRE
ncbi:molybdate ABC transporter substrate-binding protein [Nocardioides sp. zg-1308]|uniref:Molybdate ABC transporter substrate-binding protein n=1 Tax=Nocardioides renjunii TaxID=3095075 RepID=A0ABU5K6A4_9ACTN|nr:molybdate ABC transporter substrate-binding protein [Nocardioides sp. S-58]MDZ5660431.1 molybdate ABC transporter substrate-binding protein [Nocardioides sp. S-58]NPD03550.1 molybdate ABC transporter substrate-binding protein [Nocardioides sp. zg-1308]